MPTVDIIIRLLYRPSLHKLTHRIIELCHCALLLSKETIIQIELFQKSDEVTVVTSLQ